MNTPSQRLLLLLLSTVVVLLAILSLTVGSESIPLLPTLRGKAGVATDLYRLILVEVRLPRTLIALVAGASLGACGAAMQGLLRNPLASPGLIGSASGAALGAVITLYFGVAALSPMILPLGGVIGALVATLLVWLLAGRDTSILTLILAGIAINSLALALISLILNLAPSPYAVREMVHWMLGSVADRSNQDLWILMPGTLLGWLLLSGSGRELDALTLGEETATSLGVNLKRLRLRLFLATSLAVGSAVAITGTIGFVGLVVPHLLRPLVGHQPSRLLTASALGGAALLLAADIGVRLMPAQTEIKVGVLTSLVGAPFFLYLILQHRGYRT